MTTIQLGEFEVSLFRHEKKNCACGASKTKEAVRCHKCQARRMVKMRMEKKRNERKSNS